MLSGIGPKQQLDALAIPPLLHSPVGQNLQDHVMVPITLKSRTIPSLSEANGTLSNFLRYLRSSDGGLNSSKFTVVAQVYCGCSCLLLLLACHHHTHTRHAGPFSSVGLEGTAFYRSGALLNHKFTALGHMS